EGEADAVVPVAPELVLPDAGRLVELHDQADLRCAGPLHVGARARVAAWKVAAGQTARRRDTVAGAGSRSGEPVAHDVLGDRRRLVAGLEDRRVDRVADGA